MARTPAYKYDSAPTKVSTGSVSNPKGTGRWNVKTDVKDATPTPVSRGSVSHPSN